jgi:hypothetical protein
VDVSLRPDDLAPGDRAFAARDWSELSVRRVASARDPEFELAYEQLWHEFGGRGEMETRRVIEERIAWDPARPVGHCVLAYELLVLRRGGTLAALRDHTAVVRLDAKQQARHGPVVVHLSHALVSARSGSGLAGGCAAPLQAARRCAAAAGAAPDAPVVLVAEMDPPDPAEPARGVRLRSYERAGFRKLEPAAAPYAQPDFRPAEMLAGDAAPQCRSCWCSPRRKQARAWMPRELAAVVEAIYAVMASRSGAARPVARRGERPWTARNATFRLLPPTA